MKSSNDYAEKIELYMEKRVKSVNAYFDNTNQILGLIGVSLGLGCLGTENPKFFASLCLVLVIASWGVSIDRLHKDIDELKRAGHPIVKPMSVLKHTWQSMIALAFLAAIAAGEITKQGF